MDLSINAQVIVLNSWGTHEGGMMAVTVYLHWQLLKEGTVPLEAALQCHLLHRFWRIQWRKLLVQYEIGWQSGPDHIFGPHGFLQALFKMFNLGYWMFWYS